MQWLRRSERQRQAATEAAKLQQILVASEEMAVEARAVSMAWLGVVAVMGKEWENHRKMMVSWDIMGFHGILWDFMEFFMGF